MNPQDFNHESWCDTTRNIAHSCNCIIGYPLEALENTEQELSTLRARLKESEEVISKLANDQSPPWDNLEWKRICREYQQKYKAN